MMQSLPELGTHPILMDFFTNRKMLENYSNQKDPKPSLPQLIDLILRQASLENKDETYLRLMRCHRVDVDNRTFSTSARNRAAKTMTLKLASATNWDLDAIEKDMSITMQFCLVQDLMNTVFSGTPYCSSISDPPNQQERLLTSFVYSILEHLEDQCIFGLVVYARWILRAHIQRKIPKRPAKGGIVSIGSITDPDVLQGLDQQAQGCSLIWTLFRQISYEKVSQTAVELLGQIFRLERSVFRVPVQDSFVITSSPTRFMEEHKWSIGWLIPFIELKTIIAFDLAKYWLFEGKLAQTTEYLKMVNHLLTENSDMVYFKIDRDVLVNMYRIVNLDIPYTKDAGPDVLTPLAKSRNLEILLDDIQKGAYSSSSRFVFEQEVLLSDDPSVKNFYVKIRLCNILRDLTTDKAVPTAMLFKKVLTDASVSDADWLRGVISKNYLSPVLQTIVCKKLRFLAENDLLQSTLKAKFLDLGEVDDKMKEETTEPPGDIEIGDMSQVEPSDPASRIMSSYSFVSLKKAISDAVRMFPKLYIRDLNPAWSSKIPPTLRASFTGSAWTSEMSELVYVTFGKAAELVEESCFHGARQLLKQLRDDLSNVPSKLEKNFRWQNTYVDLVRWLHQMSSPLFPESARTEAVKRAKACITSTYMKLPDEEPVPIYVQNVAIMVLFNLEVWDYIDEIISTQDPKRKSSGSSPSLSAIFPFLKLLISACNEYIPQREDLLAQSQGIKTKQATINRQNCMKLWNTLSSILSKHNVQDPKKHPPTSSCAPVSLEVFWLFVKMIRHKTASYLLLCCFCRMWSVIARETNNMPLITEILWPSSIPLHCMVAEQDISFAVESIFEVAESAQLYDSEVMRTEANYFFAQQDFIQAIKRYLLSGIHETSAGYLHPPHSPQFDPSVISKMAVCFESMRCYTCVAILCQLMSPVDFDTAFRALGEKVTYDASDELYKFIWEPTILEHLAFTLQKSGFLEKRQVAVDLLQSSLLTASNPAHVTAVVKANKTAEFFEVMFDQFVI